MHDWDDSAPVTKLQAHHTPRPECAAATSRMADSNWHHRTFAERDRQKVLQVP